MELKESLLNRTVKEAVEDQFELSIKNRISILESYTGKTLDYDDIVKQISNMIVYGYPSDNMELLNGNDEYDYTVLDNLTTISECVEDYTTKQLINFLDNGVEHIEEYSTEWIVEDITEIYDEDYKDLYKKNHFDYCSSYSGTLYLTTNGSDYCELVNDLKYYDDDLEIFEEQVERAVGDFDIDDLFNRYMVDNDLVKTYSVDYDYMKDEQKRTEKTVVSFLKRNALLELNKTLKHIEDELKVIQPSTIAGLYLVTKKTSVTQEIKDVEEAVAKYDGN